ncbi:MAG: tetratricopeptide repeat protein [Lachnospiraceae bacterium]|nr:tetratricopeptide repeat protein [Lachnospiraceae bacterium]
MEPELKQNGNRKTILIAAVIAAIALAAGIGVYVYSNSPARRLQQQLDLGTRYLSELDYDQAVAAYEAALEIDPKSVDAYLGLIDAYLAQGDAENARSVLERGMQALTGEDAERLAGKTAEIERLEEELARAAYVGGVLMPMWVVGEEYHIMNGYGGIIPVSSRESYGAMDYEGNLVVPCEYTDFRSASLAGYLTMVKDGTHYLFDATGREMYSGRGRVMASGNMYIVADGIEDNYDGSQGMQSLTYYFPDGSVAASFGAEDNLYFAYGNYGNGFYDGKSMLLRRGDPYYLRDDFWRGHVSYEYGYVDESGNVTWQDGDGRDESDTATYMTAEERDAADEAERNRVIAEMETGGAGAFAWGAPFADPPPLPISGLNNGYFVSGMEITDSLLLYRPDAPEAVMDLFPYGFETDGDELRYVCETEFNGEPYETPTYMGANARGADGMITRDTTYADISGYYHDGAWFYNYGSKMVLLVEGKQVLVDFGGPVGDLNAKVFDSVDMSEEKYWLVSKDGKWGYIDHDGNVMQMYDDAAAFWKGYAAVMEDGRAYLINEQFERLGEIREADSLYQAGEILVIMHQDRSYLYRIAE